jgi:hypothetical protein
MRRLQFEDETLLATIDPELQALKKDRKIEQFGKDDAQLQYIGATSCHFILSAFCHRIRQEMTRTTNSK